jgi:hypothetical protein
MKKNFQSKIGLFSIITFTLLSCNNSSYKIKSPENKKNEIPAFYEPLTYHSIVGGCGLYYRDEKSGSINYLNDPNSPTGINNPGSKIEIPKCKSWGVVILVGMIKELVPELNENKTPEILIVDRDDNPRVNTDEIIALSNLKFTNRLALNFCPLISDTSLITLQKIESLYTLFLPNKCNITQKAISDFKNKRPDVKIIDINFTSIESVLNYHPK